MREVLKLAAYRRLLVAYTLNELAWAIGALTLAVLVYRKTGSAIGAMAYFLSAQFVPALISPALVARLDQRPTRRVLPALYALEAVAFLLLAWVASSFALTPLLALTIADGVVALTARPLARAATVAVSAPVGMLREANALSNAAVSVCFLAGPALGGAVVVAGGTIAALLINSGLFAMMALALATSGALPGGASQRTPSAGRLRAAIAHARQRPPVWSLLALQATAVLFFTISVPVEVVFVNRSLHSGAGGYGALLSAWGAGAIVGSAVYARWRGLPSRHLVAIGAGSLGAGMVVMAAAPSLVVAVCGAVLVGVGNGVESVAIRTALQEQTEQQWMARIMSLSDSIFEAVPGGGFLLGGAIAALAGPRPALAVAGGGAFLIAGVAIMVPRLTQPVEPPVTAPSGSRTTTPGASPEPATRH